MLWTKSQDERVQKHTARAVCVASANDQAGLITHMPQHNGIDEQTRSGLQIPVGQVE